MKSNVLKGFTKFTAIAGLLFSSATTFAQTNKTDILGSYLDEGKTAKIEIFQRDQQFFGKIVWLEEPNIDGRPKTNQRNPDPARRDDTILGQELMKNFVFDDKKAWKKGTIYDAESGKTYQCIVTLKDEKTLKIRGYIGVPILGVTTLWYRVD